MSDKNTDIHSKHNDGVSEKAWDGKVEPLKAGEKEMIDEVVQLLEELEFPNKNKGKPGETGGRTNILTGKEADRGKTPIRAINLGKVRNYFKSELVMSNETKKKKYIPLHNKLKQLIRKHNPSFRYTSILINKDVGTDFHFDKNNNGFSYCIGIGNFTGGGVDFKIGNKIVNVDNKNKWLYYDGKSWEHRTAKEKGTRYAIIFYSKK